MTKKRPTFEQIDRAIDGLMDDKAGAYRAAVAVLEQLTDLDAERPAPPDDLDEKSLIAFHDLLSKWATQSGRSEVAIASLKTLLTLETKPINHAFTYSDLAHVYWIRDRFDDARKAYRRALAFLDEANADPGRRARIHVVYGSDLAAGEDYAAALPILEQALRDVMLDGNSAGIGGVQCCVAVALAGLGRADDADAALADARKRLRKLPPEVRESVAHAKRVARKRVRVRRARPRPPAPGRARRR